MPISADANGQVRGKFNIPANVPAGRKLVVVTGDQGSRGEVIFEGRGDIWTEQKQTVVSTTVVNNVTNVTEVQTTIGAGYPYHYCWRLRDNWRFRQNENRYWHPTIGYWDAWGGAAALGLTPWFYGYYRWGWYDPLAQTFRPQQRMQLAGAQFFVRAKGATPIAVQLRTVSNGVPTDVVLGQAMLYADEVAVNAWNTWRFPEPISLQADEEYALVVLCEDADAELAIAELGKFDAVSNRWVTEQAYQVGVLLSSSNASTWTPHQDRDLAFRLLQATYAVTQKTVNLGTVALTAATDIMLLAETKLPTSACRVEFTATLPDASTIRLDPQKPVRLGAPTTGNCSISARLIGTADASPILAPGAQLIQGTLITSDEYITRAMPAGTASRVVLIFDAYVPSGATVVPTYRGTDPGDVWTAMGAATTRALGNDWYEYTYTVTGVNEQQVAIKLALAGNASSRPVVANLRSIVTA